MNALARVMICSYFFNHAYVIFVARPRPFHHRTSRSTPSTVPFQIAFQKQKQQQHYTSTSTSTRTSTSFRRSGTPRHVPHRAPFPHAINATLVSSFCGSTPSQSAAAYDLLLHPRNVCGSAHLTSPLTPSPPRTVGYYIYSYTGLEIWWYYRQPFPWFTAWLMPTSIVVACDANVTLTGWLAAAISVYALYESCNVLGQQLVNWCVISASPVPLESGCFCWHILQ